MASAEATHGADALVIGAGVVGLAIARALARDGLETIVLERGPAIGTGTSSRNSEVIHAGLYYPTGTLKARLCVAGRDLLYRYCAEQGVAHARCGKLIVAQHPRDEPRLDAIERQARHNGVADVQRLSGAQARALEPELHCSAALLSPSTGIVDSAAYLAALHADLAHLGATVVCRCPVIGGELRAEAVVLRTGGAGATSIAAPLVVNAAGLDAQAVAASIAGLPASSVPARHLAKGSYFSLSGPSPFTRLVYPLPDDGGLGVHATLDLAGRTRFGPDVEWIADVDYRVDPDRARAYYPAIRAYWPALKDGALSPAYAGVRPKLAGPGEVAADFVIQRTGRPGGGRLVSLYGIESPGLTASLAIAEEVLCLARGA